MDRLIATNSVAAGGADVAPATGTPQFATSGNPATGTPATVLPAYAFNAIQEELIAIIAAAGIANDRTNNAQVIAAIKLLVQAANTPYAVATGTANAHVLALTPALTARTDGMVLHYKAPAANTGALTLNDGLGAVAVLGADHQALQGGETSTNGDAWVQWNSSVSGGCYILMAASGGAKQVGAATKSLHAVNLGQFVSLHATVGYLELPDGTIIQQGAFNASNAGSSVGFADTFPTACAIVITCGANSNQVAVNAYGYTTTGFTAIANTAGTFAGAFIAIGY